MSNLERQAAMPVSELLTLADHEAQRLTDENDHGAAIIIRALSAHIRARPAVPASKET